MAKKTVLIIALAVMFGVPVFGADKKPAKIYYQPVSRGLEKQIKEKLDYLKSKNRQAKP